MRRWAGSADSAADSATHKEMLRVIPAVLTAGASCASLRSPAKLLLRQLLPETESYLALKDEALLRHAASIIGGSAAAAQQEPSLIVPTAIAPPAAITAVTTSSLSHLLASVQRVVRKRPHNLFAFLRVEPNFFNQLAATFRSVQAPAMRLSKLPTLTRSFVQLLLSCAEQHVATACSDATAESPPADVVRPYFQLLSSLLLHTNQTIRFASSGAITALLFAATSAYDASPYAAEPSLDFSKPYSARPSSSGAGGSSAGLDASEAAMGGAMGGANDEEDPMELDEAETADEGSLLVEKVPPLLADASGAGSSSSGAIQFRCDVCQMCPITVCRWHCETCRDFDICDACYRAGEEVGVPPHSPEHELIRLPIAAASNASASAAARPRADSAFADGDLADAGSEVEEDAMLAMAVAMSLGSDGLPGGQGGDGSQKLNVGPPGGKPASTPPPSAARMTVIFFDLMVDSLSQLTNLGGMCALPYLQLLHRLAVHRQVPNGGWARLADQMLVDLLPSSSTAAAGGAAAAAAAGWIDKKRTPPLEVHVLYLMFLGLLLARHSSSSSSSGAAAAAAAEPEEPTGAAPASAGVGASESLYAPGQRDSLKALQRELAAHLCSKGMPEALHAQAQQLYDLFKEQASRERADGAGGGAGPQGSGLLTVKEAAPALRQLAPFFTEVAKSHDPFEESHKLALDAILRLAQRLHLTQPTAAGAVVSASALGGASLVAATTPQQPGCSEDQHGLLSRWLSLLCHIIHSSSTTFARKQAKKHLLQLCGTKGGTSRCAIAASPIQRCGASAKSSPPRAPRPAAAQRHRHHPQSQASRCTSRTTSRSSYATRCSACTRWRPRSRATGSGTASPRAAARTAPSACCCAPCSTCRARRSLVLCASSLWALMGGRRHRRRASTRLLPPRVPRRRRLSLL